MAPSVYNHLPPQIGTFHQSTYNLTRRRLNGGLQPKGPPKLGHRKDWELRYDKLQRHRTHRAHNHTCTITIRTNCNHTGYTSSNGEETTQDTTTVHTTHDPTTAQHTFPTSVQGNRPVTLRDIRDIMTHSMREFQHSIQQMVTPQIETQIRSTIPIPSLPPSSSQLYNNQNTRPLPTQPRQSAPPNSDLLDAQMLASFSQTASSVRISRLPTRLVSQISRGEFVNFDTLLTASTSGIADPPFTVTVQQGSESSQSVCLSVTTAEVENTQLWHLAGGVEHIPRSILTLPCIHDTTNCSSTRPPSQGSANHTR